MSNEPVVATAVLAELVKWLDSEEPLDKLLPVGRKATNLMQLYQQADDLSSCRPSESCRRFPNLAMRPEPRPSQRELDYLDGRVLAELHSVGLVSIEEVENGPLHQDVRDLVRKGNGEVPTYHIGVFPRHEECGWVFKRYWRYWVCAGPGLPLEVALQLHHEFGDQVRVNGHGGCLSPLSLGGLGVGHYHVDTFEGLEALVKALRAVRASTDALLLRQANSKKGDET